MKVDLKKLTLCMVDSGLTTHYAQLLAKYFKEVVYHLPDSDTDRKTNRSRIGTGISGVRVVDEDSFWELVDEGPGGSINLFFFPDLGYQGLQEHIRTLGFPVAGNGYSGVYETDKYKFYKLLEKMNLPVSPFERVIGMDALRTCLEKQKAPVFVKLRDQRFRGVIETFPCEDMDDVEPVLEDIAFTVGVYKDEIEFLVQQKITSECEFGNDTLAVDGEFPKNGMGGIEGKNSWYVGMICEDYPEITKPFMEAIGKVHSRLGCAGMFSSEIRITEDGKAYVIDVTERVPSPPGELFPEMYEDGNFASAVYDMAHGNLPTLKPKAERGVQLVLTSDWLANGHRVRLKIPKEIERYVKLKNYCIVDGNYWCLPNDNDGYLGGVVAVGKTLEEAAGLVNKYAAQIKCYKLHYEDDVINASRKTVEKAHKFGIKL